MLLFLIHIGSKLSEIHLNLKPKIPCYLTEQLFLKLSKSYSKLPAGKNWGPNQKYLFNVG